jgi:uncharacterized membrane protein YqjE
LTQQEQVLKQLTRLFQAVVEIQKAHVALAQVVHTEPKQTVTLVVVHIRATMFHAQPLLAMLWLGLVALAHLVLKYLKHNVLPVEVLGLVITQRVALILVVHHLLAKQTLTETATLM